MDTRSRLAESREEVSNTDDLTPQQRLQRLADAFDAEQDWSERLVRETFGPEQDRTVHAPAPVRIEAATRTTSPAWRNLKLFLAIVVVVTAAAGALLQFLDPPRARLEATPTSGPVATIPLQPAPTPAPPVQTAMSSQVALGKPSPAAAEASAAAVPPENRPMTHFISRVPSSDPANSLGPLPAPSNPTTPDPMTQTPAVQIAAPQSPAPQSQAVQTQAMQSPAKQSTDPAPAPPALTPAPIPLPAPVIVQAPVATATIAPPAVDTPRPETMKPIVLPRMPSAVAGPPAKAPGVESALDAKAEAAVLIYYPPGSPLGEANARNLAARIGSSATSFDFRAETSVPAAAVVRFSDAKDHALARTVGKALTSMVYSWKIESAPSSGAAQQRTVEVWLPAK